MAKAKRCECGTVLQAGESHDCPVHGRRVAYSDNYGFQIVDALTGVALLDDDGSVGDLLGDVVDGLFS